MSPRNLVSTQGNRSSTAPVQLSPEQQDVDLVGRLNEKHFVVTIGGRTYIATEVVDPQTGHKRLELGGVQDLKLRYANQTVRAHGREICVAELWLRSLARRQYEGIVFAPGEKISGHYNLWTGFAVEPKQGDCSLFWEHVRQVICRGNEFHYLYIRRWLAHMIQHPAELPGVAPVILGSQGTGKTIFVDLVGALIGPHYVMLNRMEQLTGRFTGHLKDALLVYANEAIWGGDKQGEGALKSIITDDWSPVEAKGKDLFNVRNVKRVIVSSNEQWAVPMAMDDRRFLVLEVSEERKGDSAYFSALMKQMHGGGLQALLYDLQHEDLTEFDVRAKPQSSSAFGIKLRSSEPVARWWFEVLHEGNLVLPTDLYTTEGWEQEPDKDGLHRAFLRYCEEHHLRTIDKPLFGKAFRGLLAGCMIGETRPSGGRRARAYIIPTLDECREAFQRYANVGPEIWE